MKKIINYFVLTAATLVAALLIVCTGVNLNRVNSAEEILNNPAFEQLAALYNISQ